MVCLLIVWIIVSWTLTSDFRIVWVKESEKFFSSGLTRPGFYLDFVVSIYRQWEKELDLDQF